MSKLFATIFIGDVERVKQKVKNFLFPSRGVKKSAILRLKRAIPSMPRGIERRKRWVALAPLLTLFIFSLALVGCVKNIPNNNISDDPAENKIKREKPVISSEDYKQSLNVILQPYWDSRSLDGIKDEILELTAPAEFLNLHLNIVIAFELIEQGQEDADQGKIEDGIDRLNNLANQNDWLR